MPALVHARPEFREAIKHIRIPFSLLQSLRGMDFALYMTSDKLRMWAERVDFWELWNMQYWRVHFWVQENLGYWMKNPVYDSLVWIQKTPTDGGAVIAGPEPGILTLAIVLPNPLEELVNQFTLKEDKMWLEAGAAPVEEEAPLKAPPTPVLTRSNPLKLLPAPLGDLFPPLPSPVVAPPPPAVAADPEPEEEEKPFGVMVGRTIRNGAGQWFTQHLDLGVGDVIVLEPGEYINSEGGSVPFLVIRQEVGTMEDWPSMSEPDWGERLEPYYVLWADWPLGQPRPPSEGESNDQTNTESSEEGNDGGVEGNRGEEVEYFEDDNDGGYDDDDDDEEAEQDDDKEDGEEEEDDLYA